MTIGDYTRVNFVDEVTPLDETNMNNMDAKINEIDGAVGDAITNEHTHSNKALLDTYTQTDTDIADAISKEHTHSNKSELDLVTDGEHDVRTDNPHGVTKTQVGLSNVLNDAQLKADQLETAITDDDTKVPSSGAVVDYINGKTGAASGLATLDATTKLTITQLPDIDGGSA